MRNIDVQYMTLYLYILYWYNDFLCKKKTTLLDVYIDGVGIIVACMFKTYLILYDDSKGLIWTFPTRNSIQNIVIYRCAVTLFTFRYRYLPIEIINLNYLRVLYSGHIIRKILHSQHFVTEIILQDMHICSNNGKQIHTRIKESVCSKKYDNSGVSVEEIPLWYKKNPILSLNQTN